MLHTAPDVVKALGGLKAVQELTGAQYGAVCNWSSRNKFPCKFFVLMQAELKARSIEADPKLWGME